MRLQFTDPTFRHSCLVPSSGGEERGRSQYVRVPNKGARRLLVIVLDLSHPIVWLVRHVCSDKTDFPFLQNKIAFSNVYSLLQSLQGIEWMVSVCCSFVTGSLALAKICPEVWKGALSNFNVVAIQNYLDGFRNNLNVRNNSKTSRWFLFIRSAISCN